MLIKNNMFCIFWVQLNLSTINGNLGDRTKWPLSRFGPVERLFTRVNVWTVCQKNGGCREMTVVER